jgi:DNA-directed RNA polymerase specialized sigma24 family protein
MIDNDCAGAGLKAQDAAVELYQLAALMLGNEGDALDLVEETVSQAEIDPCEQEDVAINVARHQLVAAAVEKMKRTDPLAFVAPPSSDAAHHTCIEDDDLSAAGLTAAELTQMVNGTGREELRCWLDQLPLVQRAIFVQRAVLGWDNGETAANLKHGSDGASGWQPQQVSDAFRQALCSLANSIVHSAAGKVPA